MPHRILLSMTHSLFDSQSNTTVIVTTVYYINNFLVLGNYVLVVSHALLCHVRRSYLYTDGGGVIANILMFGIAYYGKLGSDRQCHFTFTALTILVVQCLNPLITSTTPSRSTHPRSYNIASLYRVPRSRARPFCESFAAASSIGFCRWESKTSFEYTL